MAAQHTEIPTHKQEGLALLLLLLFFGFSCWGGLRMVGSPVVRIHDESAYLLAGEVFASGRLSVSAPAPSEFFQPIHMLVEPSYQVKYPPAQSLYLAIGFLLGSPLFGVWLSTLLFALSVYYAARGVLNVWPSFSAGCLVFLLFGFAYYWNSSYWGGSVAGLGGALALGGALRCAKGEGGRHSLMMGLGVAHLFLARPFEGGLACLPLATWLLWQLRAFGIRRSFGILLPASLMLGLAVCFQLRLNQAITGSLWHYPYTFYEDAFPSHSAFVFGKSVSVKAVVQPIFAAFLEDHHATLSSYRLVPHGVLSVWTGFGDLFSWICGPFILICLFVRGARFMPLMVLVSFFGAMVGCVHFPHYQAGISGVGIVAMVCGFEYLRERYAKRLRWLVVSLIMALLGAFAVKIPASWRACRFAPGPLPAITQAVNHISEYGAPSIVLISVEEADLVHLPLIWNPADWRNAKVLRAHDLGARNVELKKAFPERMFWKLRVSSRGVTLKLVTTEEELLESPPPIRPYSP